MSKFEVGDWVYAGDYIYGQIVEIDDDDTAHVEFDTGSGGGCLPFEFSELQKAEPPKKEKLIVEPNYAVVVTFSYDPQISVLLFEDEKSAMAFIRKDAEEEFAIDEEYGRPSSLVINEDEKRAVLKTGYADGVETTEWRIGTVYERE